MHRTGGPLLPGVWTPLARRPCGIGETEPSTLWELPLSALREQAQFPLDPGFQFRDLVGWSAQQGQEGGTCTLPKFVRVHVRAPGSTGIPDLPGCGCGLQPGEVETPGSSSEWSVLGGDAGELPALGLPRTSNFQARADHPAGVWGKPMEAVGGRVKKCYSDSIAYREEQVLYLTSRLLVLLWSSRVKE